ncbi:uncharacterized protein LOC111336086, partial [Stylophora pistillata]|uniref:uncharacterized protein LOC111336086 n=1 Tax=Stylophora pistillata TaxID=50429 RepID=UPI000C040E87
MFLEKVSCLDWIGPSDENRQSSVPAASRQPNFETIEEMLPITDRQSSAYVRATSSTITSVTTANKKPSGLTSQTIVASRVPIPEKVFVVCGHFLSQRPTCDYVQAKTCQWCEDRSLLNYAVWNDIYRYWQVIRPFPAGKIPPDAPLNVCRHFAAKTSCRKEPCTYAHGEIERHLWEKQREGSLHTPNESLRLLRSINATAPTQLITQERDTDSLPLQTTVTITECVTMASFTTSLVNKCPGFDAVVTQSTITSLQPSTAMDVQSSKPSTFSHIRATTVIATPKAVPSGPIPYQGPNKDGVHIASPLFSCTTPIASSDPSLRPQFLPTSDMGIQEASSKGNTSSTGCLAEEKENPIAPIEAFVKPTDLMSKVKHEGTVLSDTLRAEVSNPSTWSSPLESNEIISTPVTSSAQTSTQTCEEIIQSSIPSQSPASEHSTNSQSSTWSNVLKAAGGPSTPIQKTNDIPSKNSPKDYRKVPTGVYVVCDHFLKENLRRAARVSPEAKPCKGCENRSKFKYAFWSVTWKQWEEISPYPKDVNIKVAFKKCRQYSKHDRCLKIPCSFAHSELELTMWTMEREGILPTPRESFTGSFSSMPSASTQRSSAMQPTSQLRHRPSPPGITNGSYRLCRSCYTRERCRFGRGCIYAHNQHELNEWKKEYDRKIKEKLEKDIKEREELFSSEMASKILKAPQEDRVEYLAGVEVICSPPEFNVKLRDKEQYKWTFTLTFQPHEVGTLRNVFLLHRYHSFYHLSEIPVGCYEEKHGSETYKLCYTAKLKGPWYKSPSSARLVGRVEVVLKVSFESPLYGSFEQLVSFDFGRKPYLVKKLTADVTSESVTLPTAPEHLATHASAIWDERSVEVVRFVHETKEALQAEHLSRKHILPRQVEITDKVLSPKIYKNVMHQLLFAEERFMREEISRYTLSNTQLHAQRNIQDDMTGMKCAVNGELFGVFRLQEDALKPDDAAGRLLYRNVNSVWLQPANSESRTVYEASVEKVGSDCVVLRLPSKLCSELRLHDTCETAVNAQFQLNRWPLCQLHEAVERLTSGQLRLIFPDPTVGTVRREVKIRWQWLLDKRLNLNQKKVIERIASHEDNALPLVVFGPFGTGKTFTLNQTVRLLVQLDKSNRILLCTHSNRAADLHVELLHEYLTEKNGTPAARPLRVYQPMRRLETASTIARKYCLIEEGMFVLPRRDDVVERRVVITTLGTSRVLLDLEVLHGFFTHILIDEAAQALEPEALNPLKFAGTNTKIVFTGDHMQVQMWTEGKYFQSFILTATLIFYCLLPSFLSFLFVITVMMMMMMIMMIIIEAEASKGNPKLNEESNVLWLRENYRCNEHILKFPSENFYGKKLIARGHESQPAHPNYGPLLFFSARGKETKEQGNSYLNLSEVYEVEKRVKEISDNWPAVWGPKILSDIAVLSSYRYQVQAIRRSLRKEKDLRDVTVDTIHNVQGEEFRVLFISTVRTFHTCKPQQEDLLNSGSDGQLYWEFLSDPKLLNTAVTRARCMIAVVGDPVSLCTMGECRGIWRDYIKRCYKAGGLHGTTMEELTSEIRASVASVQLNPIARAFIPSFLPKIEKGLDAKAPEDKTIESTQDDVCVKVKVEKQNVGKVIETRSDSRGASGQQILNEGSAENDDLDGRDRPILNLKDQDRDQDEEEPDDDNADSNYFQECLLEDETVFPQDMDEIIQAFVRKCEETLKIDEERRSVFEDSEFPSLQTMRDLKQQPIEHVQRSGFKGGADIKDLFPEVRVINGRVEVRLTNLGFYSSPSERAKRVMISSRQQDFLDPSVLMKLIADEPEKYIVCNLRLSPEKLHVGYAEVEDTKTPSIQIKGKLRQAFDRDKVVVEIGERKAHSKTDENEPAVQGRVVGVLEHIISPHERQFVCTTDYESPAVMVPINKAATKLVNLTDKSCKNIPVYKKDQYGRAIKVRMLKREKVLNGKYLFVVKYLQWRSDFSNPLGIVVRALSKGEDLKSSMEIAYAEHGVRRKFKEQTLKYVGENFPPGWSIPKAELNNRTRVSEAITIDPPSSLDLDDALTIEDISSSTFLVGIHIADVSFFVRPNTPIDDEAFARCTSYYPGHGHENVPMLPRPLSENFCSLLPNEDRLAVSVFVTLDEEGKQIGDPQIKRTIVRSCCRLNYVEAQMIIDKIDESTLEIPEGIKRKVRQLSSLAQKRRIHRLGDGAFDHWQNGGNDFEAHELVEEWMILANEEIAKLLSHRNSELALLRIQLPPKDHRLAEWIKMYGKYTRMSLTLSATFTEDTTNTTSFVALHDESIKFKIQKQVWCAICQAAESNDFPSLQYLICNESNYPQIATAVSHFRRLQAESRCVCEGDQSPENIYHYSLRIPRYTRFTSPIRRYIDIVVHRLLIGLVLTSSSCNTVNLPSKDEVLKVCRRYTFMQDNARKFEKYCKKIHMANQLQQRCRETRVFVESIQHQSICLQISNKEDDLLSSKDKRIALSHLNLLTVDEKEEIQGKEQSIVLKWKIRKYVAPDYKGETPELSSAKHRGIDEVIEIPPDIWVSVLNMVRAKDEDKLISTIKEAKEKLSTMPSNREKDTSTETNSSDQVRGIYYQHPHQNDKAQPSSEGMVDHFYEKKVILRKYDFLSVQLCPHMIRGILQPNVQIVKVDNHLNVCIEHRKYPRETFSRTTRHQASRERYESIEEYIQTWEPVLSMEAATQAVRENDGFTIENLNVAWKRKAENARGVFKLPLSYCDSRQLDFHNGDLVCIRMSYCETSPPSGESENGVKSSKDNLHHSNTDRTVSDFWVAHCIIKNVNVLKKKSEIKVKMDLHQSASNIPEGLSNEQSYRCTLELIHRTLPQRRMYAALCSLEHSSEVVHAICRGDEPSKENYGELPTSFFLTQYGFKRLNTYQKTAVKQALCNPFTLIQGPPGTGKTVTGVHIAYWFAEQNKTKSCKLLEKETGETENDGAHKSPPQVIYCGPSNKSVDVVTELLLKIPDLKVLRVYSDQVEQKEFPIPNKLKPARTTRSDDEMKISSDQIRSVSLHHVIRDP